NKSYDLIGYRVRKKGSTKDIETRFLDEGWSLDRIRSSFAIVKLGGMNIYMIYRLTKIPTPPPSGTPSPTPKVTVTPTPKPSVTPKPTVPPVAPPVAADPISLPVDVPNPSAVINGDKYTSPYFTSEKGISTTESQYVYVKTKDYLLGYTLVNHTGKKAFYVPVTMNYTLEYYTATPPKAGGPKKIVEKVANTQTIKVERAFSYWEIENLEYYTVNNAVINNYSLPDGRVLLSANNTYLNYSSLSTSHSSDINSHVLAPSQVYSGITLDSPNTYSSSTSDRPIVDYEDLTNYAQTMTDQAQVKNDYLKFGSSVVLSDAASSKIAPSPNVSSLVHTSTIILDKALYTDNKVIDAEKINGLYPSTGTVTYSLHPASVNASHLSKTYNVGVNGVTIHTPVICVPVVTADNKKWSQLISPSEDAVQIVLDPDNTLNDFDVSISNTLKHSNRLGYLSRDFSRSFINPEFISYIARQEGVIRNEVKLPFDVYLDIYHDNNKENDKFIRAGTWFVLGRDTFRFCVPMWVQEGVYTAEFRSIAVNGTNRLNKTEVTKNADIDNYVATATVNFEVSGRIYGLKIYDVYDYPKWENVFRVDKTMLFKLFEGAGDGTKRTGFNDQYAYYYSVGTKDQYGKDTGTLSRFTLPLINGSHPKYNNLGVLKTGYAVRFMLDTVGEMYTGANCIKIYPSFYYVDSDGKNRRRVDLYYDEEINRKSYHLVKIGEGIDLVNLKRGMTGNIYSRIPELELRNTAKVLDITFSDLYYKNNIMYAYSTFRLFKEFRTFIGTQYAREIASYPSFEKVKDDTGLNASQISKYMQRWYGNYKLPDEVHVVEAGYDVYGHLRKYGIDYKEDFWLKNGYIVVNFNIVTIDKAGKERLSYSNGNNYMNGGYCSMSITEGTIMSKKDNKGVEFKNKAGDILYFYTDQKYNDDFEGRIY
ncbi:MAG: putative secreted protein, partial [Firmicutes bacterium]|nr:putative secreted protein [Bacillota bacterium]